ncbi:hypothetical protein M758_UG048300 [Ceratodon purpureus]|nr:hypothetical protein M758_UG048300 [Ceratodon purpureus]
MVHWGHCCSFPCLPGVLAQRCSGRSCCTEDPYVPTELCLCSGKCVAVTLKKPATIEDQQLLIPN